MIPDTRDHKDAHECFTKILGDIHSEIFQFESDELSALYQWKLFTLNRCLVPECQKISGKRVVMWTYPIQVPIINDTINMQSLLWTHSTGRFTTEEDEVCKSCSCKPAAHHVELIDVMPKILTFSINRIQCNQFGNLQRVYTPILCDLRINLRGMTARNFDENDIECTLLAAILHKGPFVHSGHFIAYVFNSAHTAIMYDDTIVKEVCCKSLVNSNDFKENVYMLFYARGVRQHHEKQVKVDKDSVDKDGSTGHSKWKLSAHNLALVKKAWSYKKDILIGKSSTFNLNTLKPSNWLNDEVVNGFLETITAHNIKVHAYSSHLFTALHNEQWNSKLLHISLSVDPKDYELLLFPVHSNNHWQLVACYPNSCLLVFFDSMLNINLHTLGLTLGFLETMFAR